jgi:hypothetical protein
MRRRRSSLYVVALAIGIAPAGGLAQVVQPPPVLQPPPVVRPLPPAGWTVEGQEVEGTVTGVDRDAGALTLDNGEQYLVPPALRPPVATLDVGTSVRLRYGVQGGRNILTALQLTP